MNRSFQNGDVGSNFPLAEVCLYVVIDESFPVLAARQETLAPSSQIKVIPHWNGTCTEIFVILCLLIVYIIGT